MIELYLLEQLDKFASCGTLSEAAEQLHMTQPTLTRSMKKLEEYFDFPLFERKKKRIVLNETGKLLAEYAKKILEEEQKMESHVRAYNQSLHSLNVGSIASGPLFHFLPSLTALYPDKIITSTVATEEALLRGLFADEYNIIFLTHPVKDSGYVSQKYVSEQLYACITKNHPLAAKSSLSLSDMNGETFFICAESEVWANIVHTYMPDSSVYKQESPSAMAAIYNRTDISTFTTNLSDSYLPPISSDRIAIPFSDEVATVTYYIIYNDTLGTGLEGHFTVPYEQP